MDHQLLDIFKCPVYLPDGESPKRGAINRINSVLGHNAINPANFIPGIYRKLHGMEGGMLFINNNKSNDPYAYGDAILDANHIVWYGQYGTSRCMDIMRMVQEGKPVHVFALNTRSSDHSFALLGRIQKMEYVQPEPGTIETPRKYVLEFDEDISKQWFSVIQRVVSSSESSRS